MLFRIYMKAPVIFRKIGLIIGLFYRRKQRGLLFSKINNFSEHELFKIKDSEIVNHNYITTKSDIRKRKQPKPVKDFIKGRTSGSTGEPLTFFREKKSVRYEYEIYEWIYRHYANKEKFTTARISSISISNPKNSRLVGLYLHPFKRLQLSSKHIGEEFAYEYNSLLNKYNPELGTGYATSWYDLAVIFDKVGLIYEGFNAIITDSSGLSQEQKNFVERIFNTNVVQTYGLAETGMVAVQCQKGCYHPLARTQINVFKDGKISKYGKGELLVTDINAAKYPYINYLTGDVAIVSKNECDCEFKSEQVIEEIIGRVDDYIKLPNGTKLRGGLTKIIKDLEGVSKVQIVQTKSLDIKLIVSFKNNVANKSDLINTIYNRSLSEFPGLNVLVVEGEDFYYTEAGKFKFIVREG